MHDNQSKISVTTMLTYFFAMAILLLDSFAFDVTSFFHLDKISSMLNLKFQSLLCTPETLSKAMHLHPHSDTFKNTKANIFRFMRTRSLAKQNKDVYKRLKTLQHEDEDIEK